MSKPIPNKVRAERKRLGLSQEEIATLSGGSRDAISELERYVAKPTLELAFALALVFGKQIDALFPGAFERMAQQVSARARTLRDAITNRSGANVAAKKQSLASLLARLESDNKHV